MKFTLPGVSNNVIAIPASSNLDRVFGGPRSKRSIEFNDLWKLLEVQAELELCGFQPPKYVPTSYALEAEKYQ